MIILPGKFVSYDGEVVLPSLVPVNFSSRAFRFGDSLFESVRVGHSTPLFLDKHLNRLLVSMPVLKMEPVVPLDFNNVTLYIERLLKSNRFFSGCRLRLTLFREGSGFYLPETNKAHILIEAFQLENPLFEINAKGLKVDIYPDIKKAINPLSGMKSGNAMLYILASEWYRENNLDDCIILNESGNVCEATSSNIFVYRKNTILTPSLDEGCVAGIMREVVIEKACQNGITVCDDTYITRNELLSAEEIFLTNAIKGIQPVLAYQSKRYYSKVAKQLTGILNKEIS
jgi:branched-subunit amino acid aminotransferase/4-amino-4-deoxychorismate lyase